MSNNDLIGTGWHFPPYFRGPQTGPEMVFNEAVLDQSIYVILNTIPGEHVLNSNFGSALSEYVFQSIDDFALANIRADLASAIGMYEPRLKLLSIDFDTNGLSEGILNIELSYSVIDTNDIRNMVFPLYVQNL